jgi:hypothetical protein
VLADLAQYIQPPLVSVGQPPAAVGKKGFFSKIALNFPKRWSGFKKKIPGKFKEKQKLL